MSSSWDAVDDDGGDNEIEKDVDWGGRDGVIFLIEATAQMFDSEEDEDSPFLTSVKCSHMTMMNKVVSSTKDLVAVVLFGTDKTDNPLHVKHIVVLQPLEQPNIANIKALDKIISSPNLNDFAAKYGHSNEWKLYEALWICQFLFSGSPVKMASQRILLFTCCDDPHIGQPAERQKVLERGHDLRSVNISLELLPMDRTFQMDIFYKELVETVVGEEYARWALPATQQRLEELLTRCCRPAHKKRTLSRVSWHLGPGVELAMGVYSVISTQQPPKKVWMEPKQNQMVKSVRQYIVPVAQDDEEPDEPKPSTSSASASASVSASTSSGSDMVRQRPMQVVLPMDIVKYKVIGGEKIVFQPHEVAQLKELTTTGFKLMGFKPREAIPVDHHFGKAYFLFPDESRIKGSRRLFAALLDRCAAKDVVAICWGMLKKNGSVNLYALFPQEEFYNPESGIQERPGGFHAFPLPTSEYIRNVQANLSKEEEVSPSAEQKAHMDRVVSRLSFKYNVHNFRNPQLQALWACIEALALDLPEAREVTDDTKPDYDEMSKQLGDLGASFKELFYPDGFDPDEKRKPASASKRAAASGSSGAGRAAKATKGADVDVEEMVRLQKVEKLKVDQLKQYLMTKGKKVTGLKKADLVDLVYAVNS